MPGWIFSPKHTGLLQLPTLPQTHTPVLMGTKKECATQGSIFWMKRGWIRDSGCYKLKISFFKKKYYSPIAFWRLLSYRRLTVLRDTCIRNSVYKKTQHSTQSQCGCPTPEGSLWGSAFGYHPSLSAQTTPRSSWRHPPFTLECSSPFMGIPLVLSSG